MAHKLILLTLLVLLGACTVGPRAETAPLARQPRGALVTLDTSSGTLHGELLEVQDTALLVLTDDQRITLVSFAAIRRGDVELVRQPLRGGRAPTPEYLERLRRFSRFPQGLTPEMQRALLAAYAQGEIRVVGQ